jgi:hypothetical protein
VAHEFLHHRCFSEWHCIGDCGRSFSERCEFVAHILEDHLKSSNSGMNIDEIVDSREQKSAYSPPRAINCPFCLEQIEETKRTFQKHVGRHFDEIALKTLPLEVFDAQNEEPEILKDNELSDSDDWSRRSSFLSLDEPVDIKNMTAQTVCTDEDHTIMNGGDAEGSCRGDSVQEKLNPAGKSITDRNVSREDSVGDYSSIAPTTTNNTNDDVDRIVESPPSPDVDRPFFEEPRPLWRTETNSPAPPTSIGITRSNHVVRRRRSAQWLFKGFSVRRDIFRMKLDEDQ